MREGASNWQIESGKQFNQWFINHVLKKPEAIA
jgi:hypothetical protein